MDDNIFTDAELDDLLNSSVGTISTLLPNYKTGVVTSTYGAGINGTYINTNASAWGSITNSASQPSLNCTGDASFAGDVTIKGVSIAKALADIQQRLAILVPDPAKLAHFESLKKAYDHYKMLESLCQLPSKND